MKKIILMLVVACCFSNVMAQSTNNSPTRFTAGLLPPSRNTAPFLGVGSLWHDTADGNLKWYNGTSWVTFASGVTGVSSVFGRTGAVVASSYDYSSFYYPLTGNPSSFLTASTGVSSLTGTTNQVVVSGSVGAVTLSLPQSLATTSTPTFSTVTGQRLWIDNTVTNRDLKWMTSGLDRWIHRVNNTAESGSNVGSNYQFLSRDDTGAALFTVYTAVRSTGEFNVPNLTTVTQTAGNSSLSAATTAFVTAAISATGTGASNLALGTPTSTTYPITNSNGTGFTLPSSTGSLAGLESAADKTKLDAITGTNTGNQSLSVGGAGLITINGTGGNSVNLLSLGRAATAAYPDANTPLTSAGLYPYGLSGVTTNYPASGSSSGIKFYRDANTFASYFEFWKDGGGTDALYFRTGIDATTANPWDIMAGRTWVGTQTALKQNLVTLTTTGTSGAATFNQSTGALNIPQYAYTFNNGLTNTSGTVQLGGNLTKNTVINPSGFSFGVIPSGVAGPLLSLSNTGALFGNVNSGGTLIQGFQFDPNVGTTAMQVTDLLNTKGLVYTADYSANFTARSIVDKGYVDAAIAGAGGSTVVGGKLTASGNGATLSFAMPHGKSGINSTYSAAVVTALNPASGGFSHAFVDATNVTVVYTVAPASGTNNLNFSYIIMPNP